MKILFIIALLLPSLLIRLDAKTIDLDNPYIHVTGAHTIKRSKEQLHYFRFPESFSSKGRAEIDFKGTHAQTTSGIKILFKTNSESIRLSFKAIGPVNKGSQYLVKQNGKVDKTYLITKSEVAAHSIGITSKNEGPTEYEIVLPSFSDMALVKLEIDDNSELEKYTPKQKKLMFNFGDSITHGTGQNSSSYLTYPYILADKLGVSYHNLAVGGARLSLPLSEVIHEYPQADIITILIGYNDMKYYGTDVYKEKYHTYFNNIRKAQPKAKIFLISMTYTERKTSSFDESLVPDDYRKVVYDLYEKNRTNDPNLFLIKGEEITSRKNLRIETFPTDLVHFGIEGAELFANELYKIISKKL